MAFLDEHKAKFDNLTVSLELQNREQLKLKANGGNTILFTYPPADEIQYIEHAKSIFTAGKFKFINIAELFVKFIEDIGLTRVERKYKIFVATPHKLFSSGNKGLLELIIAEIKEADDSGLIPILIRTGTLYGTGIENVNIMEHSTIMCLKQPLVIFYPSKFEGDNLYFINFKPASKYRCTVIK